jgi:hypothetical protein
MENFAGIHAQMRASVGDVSHGELLPEWWLIQ